MVSCEVTSQPSVTVCTMQVTTCTTVPGPPNTPLSSLLWTALAGSTSGTSTRSTDTLTCRRVTCNALLVGHGGRQRQCDRGGGSGSQQSHLDSERAARGGRGRPGQGLGLRRGGAAGRPSARRVEQICPHTAGRDQGRQWLL